MKSNRAAAVLLVAASLMRPGAPSAGETASQSGENSPAREADEEIKDPATFLCRFFDPESKDSGCIQQLGTRYKWNTLIATLPDPNRTHLALYFDRNVEALVWAVHDSGYTLAGRWFPWKDESDERQVDLALRQS